jgi:hypothetical protein
MTALPCPTVEPSIAKMSPSAIVFSTPAQREMLRILTLVYGGERRALDAVDHARAASAVAVLPGAGNVLFEFVARDLVPVLTTDLGPRLTIAVLAELEKLRDFDGDAATSHPLGRVAVAPSSDAPATGPWRRLSAAGGTVRPGRRHRSEGAVLLIDADRLGRARLARALIRRKCDVAVVESLQELKAALIGSESFGVAVVDLAQAAANDVLDLLTVLRSDLPVLARASNQEVARAALRARGVTTFATCETAAPVEDVAAIASSYVATAKE